MGKIGRPAVSPDLGDVRVGDLGSIVGVRVRGVWTVYAAGLVGRGKTYRAALEDALRVSEIAN